MLGKQITGIKSIPIPTRKKDNGELIKLSASRISCLDSCSMTYYIRYHLRIPDTTNRGSERGDICHLIFEVLGNPRHFNKYIKKIIKNNSILKIKSIKKLIEKRAQSHKLDLNLLVEPVSKKLEATDTLTCIDEMIMVGINTDFINLNNKELIKAELAFDIINENPRYRLVGYVDRLFKEGNDTISFSDFKSSKVKKNEKKLHEDIQALSYLCAARKLYPEYKKRKARFIMLRFPDKPIQEVNEPSEDTLDGFEYHLEELSEFMRNFTFEDAQRKTQAPLNRMRGGGLCFSARTGHRCSYLDPFDYWELIDQNNNLIKTVRDGARLKDKENCKWTKKHFQGCSMWKNDRPAPFTS